VSLYINHEQLEISGYQRDVASSRWEAAVLSLFSFAW
jgi:hypothetical protein